MNKAFTESVVEDAALGWLETLGYQVLHGPGIATGEPAAERSDPNYRDVMLERRLRQALVRLNSEPPPEALEDADAPPAGLTDSSFVERNHAINRALSDGVIFQSWRSHVAGKARLGALTVSFFR